MKKSRGSITSSLADIEDKMVNCKKTCWTEFYFAKHVCARLVFLLKNGYIKSFIRELVISFGGIGHPLFRLLNKLIKDRHEKKYYPGT